MSRANRIVLRTAAAVALAIGTLAVAGPAQAHPTVSGPHCDPGAGHILCIIGITGAIPPVDIVWYFNGVHFRVCDDDQFCHAGCPIGTTVGVKVVVTDASGVPVTKGRHEFCQEDPD